MKGVKSRSDDYVVRILTDIGIPALETFWAKRNCKSRKLKCMLAYPPNIGNIFVDCSFFFKLRSGKYLWTHSFSKYDRKVSQVRFNLTTSRRPNLSHAIIIDLLPELVSRVTRVPVHFRGHSHNGGDQAHHKGFDNTEWTTFGDFACACATLLRTWWRVSNQSADDYVVRTSRDIGIPGLETFWTKYWRR